MANALLSLIRQAEKLGVTLNIPPDADLLRFYPDAVILYALLDFLCKKRPVEYISLIKVITHFLGWKEERFKQALSKLLEKKYVRKLKRRNQIYLLVGAYAVYTIPDTEIPNAEKSPTEEEEFVLHNPTDPVVEVIKLYNEIYAKPLGYREASTRKISKSRRYKILALLKDFTLDDFKEAFEIARENPFLSGKSGRFRLTLSWLLQDPENIHKILEGYYETEQDRQRKQVEIEKQEKEQKELMHQQYEELYSKLKPLIDDRIASMLASICAYKRKGHDELCPLVNQLVEGKATWNELYEDLYILLAKYSQAFRDYIYKGSFPPFPATKEEIDEWENIPFKKGIPFREWTEMHRREADEFLQGIPFAGER